MKKTNQIDGTLYIVSTSIGNKKDITIRATEVLQNCDIIVGEEMKEASRVLMHLNLSKPIELLNEHNEKEKVGELIELLQSGKSIALISDCGTPIFADPGIELLRKSIEKQVNISVVPGASSIMTAIVRSGFDLKRFFYAGFLNRNSKERVKEIQDLSSFPYTLVVMDTPYRLKVLLEDFAEVMPNRRAYIGMNLTLQSETHHYGTFAELFEKFKGTRTRNEYVIVIEGFALGNISSVQSTFETEQPKNNNLVDEFSNDGGQENLIELEPTNSDLLIKDTDLNSEFEVDLNEDEYIDDIDEMNEEVEEKDYDEIIKIASEKKKDKKQSIERLTEQDNIKKESRIKKYEPRDRDRRNSDDRSRNSRDDRRRGDSRGSEKGDERTRGDSRGSDRRDDRRRSDSRGGDRRDDRRRGDSTGADRRDRDDRSSNRRSDSNRDRDNRRNDNYRDDYRNKRDDYQSSDRPRREQEGEGYRRSSDSRDDRYSRNDNNRRDNRDREGDFRNDRRRNKDDFRKTESRGSRDNFDRRPRKEENFEENQNNSFEEKRKRYYRTEGRDTNDRGGRRDSGFRSSSRGSNRGDRRSNRGRSTDRKSKPDRGPKKDKNN